MFVVGAVDASQDEVRVQVHDTAEFPEVIGQQLVESRGREPEVARLAVDHGNSEYGELPALQLQ